MNTIPESTIQNTIDLGKKFESLTRLRNALGVTFPNAFLEIQELDEDEPFLVVGNDHAVMVGGLMLEVYELISDRDTGCCFIGDKLNESLYVGTYSYLQGILEAQEARSREAEEASGEVTL